MKSIEVKKYVMNYQRTIIKHEQNKGKPNCKNYLCEGMTMLKCSLRTFKELDIK